MTTLIPRTPTDLTTPIPSSFSRSEGKALVRAQNSVVATGLVGGTRLAAKGFVTSLAIQQLGMLQREAEHQATGDAAHAARTEYLLDRYAEAAGQIIRGFGE